MKNGNLKINTTLGESSYYITYGCVVSYWAYKPFIIRLSLLRGLTRYGI